MMTRVASGLACLALSLTLARTFARAEPGMLPAPGDCVVVSGTAPFVGYAYNHVVVVKNGCSRPVTCEVWTDVDPSPRHQLSLKPGESVSVLVRRGSPARTYHAESACKY